MPDLEDRLRSDARAWQDGVDRRASATAQPMHEPAPRRWLAPALAAAAVLLVAAVGVVGSRPNSGTPPIPAASVTEAPAGGGPPLSVQLVLAATTARPGDVLEGEVRITNSTDQPIPVDSGECNGLVQVGLVNASVHFQAAWTAMGCAPIVIEPGVMSVPVQVRTRYSYCSQEPSDSDPQCVTEEGGLTTPKLPVGEYQTAIELNLPAELVAVGSPTTVRLTD